MKRAYFEDFCGLFLCVMISMKPKSLMCVLSKICR